MTSAIDALLDAVAWTEVPAPEAPTDGIPYATHAGILDLAGSRLRVYRLSDGRRIVHADDLQAFLGGGK